MDLVLATANDKKVQELARILAGLDVRLRTMGEFDLVSPEETGTTFEANALLKARAVATAVGGAALADDSGLEVDALRGAPGVHSARYAGLDADDAANNAKLLDRLAGVPPERRTARFVCVAALVAPGGAWTARGTMEGRIIEAPRGTGGFGYDPLFVADGESRTNAELPPREKDARSHRGAAFRAIRPRIETLVLRDGDESGGRDRAL